MRFLPLALLLAVHPAHAQTAPRQVNLTSDSQPGWIPSIEQEQSLLRADQAYFEAMEAGDFAAAHAMMDPSFRARSPLAAFFDYSGKLRDEAGPLHERRITRLTWTKDSPRAPFPGVFAELDIVQRHARIDRECGFALWYQKPEGGPFKLLRIENSRITNASAETIIVQQGAAALDRLWKEFSAGCPNYPPAS